SVAAAVVAVLPNADAPVREKGSIGVSLTVMRGDSIVADDVPIERSRGLLPGDRLRVHVSAPQSTWVVLQGNEHEAWSTYFEGTLPQDGWLPVGIAVTEEGKTRLRTIVCHAPVTPR